MSWRVCVCKVNVFNCRFGCCVEVLLLLLYIGGWGVGRKKPEFGHSRMQILLGYRVHNNSVFDVF